METMIVVTGVESPQIYGKSEAERERAAKRGGGGNRVGGGAASQGQAARGDDIDFVE
jgi:hypothetical protein